MMRLQCSQDGLSSTSKDLQAFAGSQVDGSCESVNFR